VAVVVVVECVMIIKVGDVTGVIIADSHMKKVVVTVVDEVGIADVEMEEVEAEMVVGIEMEERANRSVLMINSAMAMADHLVQKMVFGRTEFFTKEAQAMIVPLAPGHVTAQIPGIAQNRHLVHEIGDRYQKASADLPRVIRT